MERLGEQTVKGTAERGAEKGSQGLLNLSQAEHSPRPQRIRTEEEKARGGCGGSSLLTNSWTPVKIRSGLVIPCPHNAKVQLPTC